MDLGIGKTKYSIIFWVSVHDLIFLKSLETIGNRFIKAYLMGFDAEDLELPFFLNTNGQSIVEKQSLRWEDFGIVMGTGHFTSNQVRQMQSQIILESDDQLLKATKVHMLAHS